jgi:hypothetical protein
MFFHRQECRPGARGWQNISDGASSVLTGLVIKLPLVEEADNGCWISDARTPNPRTPLFFCTGHVSGVAVMSGNLVNMRWD